MLELRPNCERCDKDLPPGSTEACICSYECTFCTACVESILFNVCPNCGGGFTKRPIRPVSEHRPGVSLSHQKPSVERVRSPYSDKKIDAFCQPLKDVSPENR